MSAPDVAAPQGPAGALGANRAPGAGDAFLSRAEVRDVLAWLRLLVDPQDASAVVRALARPPIELRQVDLARVIQVARRRKLDLVGGLGAATESPQIPPEARERIGRFVELHSEAAAELARSQPDRFLERLIDLVGTRGRALLAPEEAAAQLASVERLAQVAREFLHRTPGATARDLARYLAALGPAHRGGETPLAVEALAAEPASVEDRAEERLQDTLQMLRAAVLDSVARIGGRLGELRLDTELDISHGIVRYLELLKLSALLQRPEGQSLEEALGDVNARLLAATTPLQREIYLTSALDETLLADVIDERAWAQAIAPRGEPSLGPFLRRSGVGLALSASDIETYRSCPLRYKFGRVLRIPTEQTLHQRFGIVVHQVLERYHSTGASTLAELLELLDAGWRRAGFGASERELELQAKALAALRCYHERLHEQATEPVWFERAFSFRLGPHQLRGRVDRVDRVIDGSGQGYELIDYKTSRPKTADQLRDDVQLSLYALAAREAWQLESSRQAYYYVLDDVKVPVPRSERDAEAVGELVLEVAEGILAQEFEPTPSPAACAICDHRIVCPAAES
ncbi:MAG TPA: PD-(D/E)XK nuclease family protein [Solirubrobacteraceae bacterium]|nr:PD-(D/E)XK nuclease family protein [Solirubrobacteraceae bacterium]